MYTIRFNAEAEKDLVLLQKRAPSALKKLAKLLDELKEHPKTHSIKHQWLHSPRVAAIT